MMKIVYQGVAGAYSHIAGKTFIPDKPICRAKLSNRRWIWCRKLADLAVIPVENSNAGRVADVHFLPFGNRIVYQRRIFSAGRTSAARPARLPLEEIVSAFFASAGARPVFRFPQTTQNQCCRPHRHREVVSGHPQLWIKQKRQSPPNWLPKFTDWKY